MGVVHRQVGAELANQRQLLGGELFFRRGITATGVAEISRAAGVNKRTLYELFVSKDALVDAALVTEDLPTYRRLVEQAERAGPEPLQQLEALFANLETWAGHDEFRGCPYLNAAAERPDLGTIGRTAARAHKERLRSWIAQRLEQAGAPDPTGIARELLLVYDGALAECVLTGDGQPAATARRLARRLTAAALHPR